MVYTSLCNKNKSGKSIQTDFNSSNIAIALRRVRVLCEGVWRGRGGGGQESADVKVKGYQMSFIISESLCSWIMGKINICIHVLHLFIEHFNQLFDEYDSW